MSNPQLNLSDVYNFMRDAHAGQFRNDGVTPYYTHPERVQEKCIDLFDSTDPEIVRDPRFRAMCLLHDVDEDCRHKGFTLKVIAERFDPDMANWLKYVTKPDKPPEYRDMVGKEREDFKLQFNLKHYAILAWEGPRQAHLCKIGDRLCNLEDMKSCSPAFRRFYIADTKNLIAVMELIPGIEHVRAALDMICNEAR